MSQSDLSLLLPLAWQNYLGNQPVTVELTGVKSAIEAGEAGGRYALAGPAVYSLAFSGVGYVRQELMVTVEAGVKKRVDGVMGKV